MTKFQKSKIIFLAIIFCGLFGLAERPWAATISASSCSVTDINDAIAAANSGDLISVPAGDCSWDTSAVTVSLHKTISLIGAGTGKTNITIANQATDVASIKIPPGINDCRLSGFTFITTNPNYTAITIDANIGWRIDHNIFRGFHFPIFAWNIPSGGSSLVDANEFYGGGFQIFGKYATAWSEPTGLGSGNFVFVENNKFSNLGALTPLLHAIATNGGARVVARFNDFIVEQTGTNTNFADIFDAHGYCHGTTMRAVRAYEVYNNWQVDTAKINGACSEGVYLRGGTGVVFNNQFGCNQYGRGASVALYDWRATAMADTTLTPSCSAACSTSVYCPSTTYRVPYSGTTAFSRASWPATANDGGQTMTGEASGASGIFLSWDNNYAYFTSIDGNFAPSGEDVYRGTTLKAHFTGTQEAVPGEGYPCCDQVGRGMNQAAEPLYVWNNKDKMGNALNDAKPTSALAGYIEENRDYFKSPKPDYVPYACPHPLTGLANPCDSARYGRAGYDIVSSDLTAPAAPSGLSVS